MERRWGLGTRYGKCVGQLAAGWLVGWVVAWVGDLLACLPAGCLACLLAGGRLKVAQITRKLAVIDVVSNFYPIGCRVLHSIVGQYA